MIENFEFYSHYQYRQATAEDIKNFEQKTGILLPPDYVEFLKYAGTKSPEPSYFPIPSLYEEEDCQEFYGFPSNVKMSASPLGASLQVLEERLKEVIRNYPEVDVTQTDSLLWNWETYRGRIPDDLLAIGGTTCGNQICIKISGEQIGSIWLWDHEYENYEQSYDNCYFCAPSLEKFIESFRPEEEGDSY